MSRLVNVVIPPLAQSLTYQVPEDYERIVDVGFRVEVPLGKRQATGFVVPSSQKESVANKSDTSFEIKDLLGLPLHYASFSPGQLEFFQWVADYYGEPLANVIDVAVPAFAPPKLQKTVVVAAQEEANSENPDPPRGRRQREILEFIQSAGGKFDYSDLLKRFPGAHASVKSLCKGGFLTIQEQELFDHHVHQGAAPGWAKRDVELNPEQQTALEDTCKCISEHEFSATLLHGVTGSGKTEVYINAILHARSLGYGSLVIVPEIALTPQLVDRFRARLGNELATLHSGLGKRARWDSWRALLEGRNDVAIGARSGIFAPVPNLGLIIVDEEHDSSFKQSEGLRYNARDLALVRGKLESACVLLGSATPSLETYYNAAIKKYHYHKLSNRHAPNNELSVEVIDLNQVRPWEMPSRSISPKLQEQLNACLENNEQAFILYNRRGFASYLQCEKCEEVLECPNCCVTFTYHQGNNSLLCHYCNLSMVPGEFCPTCSKGYSSDAETQSSPPGKLVPRGAGTEKIFEEIQALFPNAVIDRLDRDAAGDIREYRAVLDRVRNQQTDILVGTQMIAKGHDLPGVTLVGIVDCDVGIHMPDFRAAERVFHLLTQASGRAGRGEKAGKVLLQTRVPKHPSIVCTQSQDFRAFARHEIQTRKALGYPPFSRLLRLVVSSQDKQLPSQILLSFRDFAQNFLREHQLTMTVLGPSPAPLERLKTLWRSHLIIKSDSASDLNRLLRGLRSLKVKTNKVKVTFDLDPQEML